MKKLKIVFLLAILAVLGACGGNSNSGENSNTSTATLSIEETKALQEKIANEIISYGAVDAYFDNDNYFVYCVNKSDLSTSANEVAAAMYPMVTEVPNVKGCIVKDAQSKEELGRYEAKK